MQLIIDTANTQMSVRNKCFHIENETQKKMISPYRVESIAITSNVKLNYAAIVMAATHFIPIYFFNRYGKLIAQSQNASALDNGLARVLQYKYVNSQNAFEFLKGLLQTKTKLQQTLIKKQLNKGILSTDEFKNYITKSNGYLEKLTELKASKIAEVRPTIFGVEGNISKHYFQILRTTLSKEFYFEKRSRRPSLDIFNAALNYLYGCTYTIINQGVFAAKLDPCVGLLHVNGHKNNSLTFDLIEPIRPLIDRLLVELINDQKLNQTHFKNNTKAVWVNTKGKKILITAFHKYLHQKVKIDTQIYAVKMHCYVLAKNLKDEINKYVSDNV